MKVGDLVKRIGAGKVGHRKVKVGVAAFGIVVGVDPYGHLFVCWPDDGTYLYAPHGLELVSESR